MMNETDWPGGKRSEDDSGPGDESTDEEHSKEEVDWSEDEAAEEAENERGLPKPSIGGGGIGHDEDW